MTTQQTQEPHYPFYFTDAVEPVTANRTSQDRVAGSSEPTLKVRKIPSADAPATVHIDVGGKHLVISVSDTDAVTVEGLDAEPRSARWRVDQHGLIVWGNIDRRICDTDWSSRHVRWEAIHPEDRARVRDEWSHIMTARVPAFVMRFRLMRAGDSYVEVIHRGRILMCQEADDLEPKFCGYKGTTDPVT